MKFPRATLPGRFVQTIRINFASLGFFGLTVILKHDNTLDYKFFGDMIYHHVTGTFKIYDKKVYMLFDKEILDTNFAPSPLFDNATKTIVNKHDAISYQNIF